MSSRPERALPGSNVIPADLALMRYYRAGAGYRWPILVCVAFLLGVHAAILLGVVHWSLVAMAFLPTVGVATAAWTGLTVSAWETHLGGGRILSECLRVFGFISSEHTAASMHRLTRIGLLLLVLCCVPGVGVIALFVLLGLAALVVAGRETRALQIIGWTLLIAGAVIALSAFLRGPLAQWVVACTLGLLLLAVYPMLLNVGIATLARGISPLPDALVLVVGLVLPPVLLATTETWIFALVVHAILLVALPMALMMVVSIQMRTARSNVVSSLGKLDSVTLGVPEEVRETLEAVVRESDGYYRIVSPQYRHCVGRLAGPSGYIAWLSSTSEGSPVEGMSGRLLAIKSRSFPSFLTSTSDPTAQQILALLDRLIPNLSDDPSVVEPLRVVREDLGDARRVKEVLPNSSLRLIKAPWEHPELIIFPMTWSSSGQNWSYPPGTALYDQQGLPCKASHVKVSITLKLPPKDDRAGRQEFMRDLVWHGPRILPGCYEALLMAVMESLQRYAVARTDFYLKSVGDDSSVPIDASGATHSRTLSDLKADVAASYLARLPKPLNKLIDVSIDDLPIDTYVLDGFREEVTRIKAQIDAAEPVLRSVENTYRDLLVDYARQAESHQIAPLSGTKWTVQAEVERMHNAIVDKAHNAPQNNTQIAQAIFGPLRESQQALLNEYDKVLDRIQQRMKKLVQSLAS